MSGRCSSCNQVAPKHCETKGCGWHKCPTHGLIKVKVPDA